MSSAAEMGGMFIVPGVTVCASLQIININIRDTEPWETDWYRSLEFRGSLRAAASLFTFIHRYMVMHALAVCKRSHETKP